MHAGRLEHYAKEWKLRGAQVGDDRIKNFNESVAGFDASFLKAREMAGTMDGSDPVVADLINRLNAAATTYHASINERDHEPPGRPGSPRRRGRVRADQQGHPVA